MRFTVFDPAFDDRAKPVRGIHQNNLVS